MSNDLLKFFTGSFFIQVQTFFSWAILGGACIVYVFRRRPLTTFSPVSIYRALLIGAILFKLFISLLETLVQYSVWKQNPLAKILLAQPLSEKVPEIPKFMFRLLLDHPRGYFFYYAWEHFFLNALLSVLVAAVFCAFLVLLRKYRQGLFEDGEITLGTLMALAVGWPQAVLFIPGAFLCTILFSIARRIFFHEDYTTLGWPFLIAGGTVLVFGKLLIELLHLNVLG